jgi:hypothetical protein
MIRLRLAIGLVLPIALAACHVPDESRADDTWRPKGLNAANLAAMVENPADLVRGRGDAGPARKLAAQAVIELWSNPSAALPQGNAASGAAAPSAGSTPQGGGASGDSSGSGSSGSGSSGSGASGSGSSGGGSSGSGPSGGGTQAGAAN